MLGTRKGHRRASSSAVQIVADPDVRRWYDDLRRGSDATADVYLRRFAAFCDRVGKTPKDLVALDEGGAHRVLLDFVSSEERRGATGSYISHSVAVARSWLTFNGRPVVRRIKIREADATPTLAEERVPTQEELRRVLLAAPPQWRAAVALVSQAGLRLETLGDYHGTDGLVVRDLPDLSVSDGKVVFRRSPAMVVVRPPLSKAGHRYFSFLSAEGASHVRDYLEERIRAGEVLGPDSDIIHPARAKKRFVRTINVGDGIRAAIRLAGFDWRPYNLRAYADTQMLLSESKGRIAGDYRAFFMGHKGTIEARYTTNKGRLPDALVDDMRGAYKRCEPYIATTISAGERDAGTERILRAVAVAVGQSPGDADKTDFLSKSDAELEELFRRALGRKSEVGPVRRTVGDADLARYLRGGWKLVGANERSGFDVERP